jgi:hypothetical protein
MVSMTSRPSARPPAPDSGIEDSLEQEDAPPHEPSPRHEYEGRSSFDRILPELIRRGLEVSRGPLEKVSESIFPKELTSQLAAQLGDARSGIVKAVAHEVGRFLRDADIASELRKVLSGLDVEAQVRLRFKAREDGSLKPEVGINLGGKDSGKDSGKDKP